MGVLRVVAGAQPEWLSAGDRFWTAQCTANVFARPSGPVERAARGANAKALVQGGSG